VPHDPSARLERVKASAPLEQQQLRLGHVPKLTSTTTALKEHQLLKEPRLEAQLRRGKLRLDTPPREPHDAVDEPIITDPISRRARDPQPLARPLTASHPTDEGRRFGS
jgi:hypothetical protein